MNAVMEKSFLGQSLSQSSSAVQKQVRQAFVQRAWSARAADWAMRSACFVDTASILRREVFNALIDMSSIVQTMSKTVMMAKTAKGAQKQAAKTIKQAASTVKGAANRTTKSASKTARKTVRWEPLSCIDLPIAKPRETGYLVIYAGERNKWLIGTF